MADVFNVVNWFKPCTHTLRMKPRNLAQEVKAKTPEPDNDGNSLDNGVTEFDIAAGANSTLNASTSAKIKAVLDNDQAIYAVIGTAPTLGEGDKRQIYKVDKATLTDNVITHIWVTPSIQKDIAEQSDITFIGQNTTDWDAYVDAGVIGDTGTPIQQNLENNEILDERLAVFSQENRVTGFTFTPTLLQVTVPNVLMLVPGAVSVHNDTDKKSAVKFRIGNYTADKWGLQMVPKDNPADKSRYVTCENGTATIDGGAALNVGGNDETKNLQLTFKSDTELIFGDPEAAYSST